MQQVNIFEHSLLGFIHTHCFFSPVEKIVTKANQIR